MSNREPQLVWVALIEPEQTMDAATWLETTHWLRQLGWLVELLVVGDPTVRDAHGVTIRQFPAPARYFLGKLFFHGHIIRFILRRWRQIDVVMFHQISAVWLLPLRLLGVLPGKRPLFIMDTRDMPDYLAGSWRIALHRRYYAVAHWLANRFADAQIAITAKMADYVHIPRRQLLGTWPSGVDVDTFARWRPQRRWPQPGEPIHLIYIGSLLPKRNPELLAQAVQAANAAGMHFQLTFYGSGSSEARLREITAVDSAIVLRQPIPHHEVPQTLAQAHIGVTSLPQPDDKKYEASSPVKLFEYMASGLPMLATRNYCHTQVVQDGRYAFWAEAATVPAILDALQHIWRCRHELPRLSDEAHAVAHDWSWHSAAQKLDSALRQGIGESVR